MLREGVHVVLAGQPNVGKSSLLNRLAGEELAIVTEIPGTTRDAIRVSINLKGVPVHVIDTAGLREPDNPVEKIGIARTWAAIEKADLVLMMLDATQGETAADRAIMAQMPSNAPQITVLNKIDLAGNEPSLDISAGRASVRLSAKTGIGVDRLRDTILEAVGWRADGEGLFMARERHLQALEQASVHLDRAGGKGGKLELLAEELRLAQQALDSIAGKYTSDDLLGEIFSRFCIGK
jgi:tRNA modification GTPase